MQLPVAEEGLLFNKKHITDHSRRHRPPARQLGDVILAVVLKGSSRGRLYCRVLKSEIGEIEAAPKAVGKSKSAWVREVSWRLHGQQNANRNWWVSKSRMLPGHEDGDENDKWAGIRFLFRHREPSCGRRKGRFQHESHLG